jgi:hypothetical protein
MERKPLRAIRKHCLDCSGDSSNEVKLCAHKDCNLYHFRLGKNPYLKGGKGNIENLKKRAQKSSNPVNNPYQ